MNRILDAALGYAVRGLPVLPIKPRGKVPLTEHGCNDATTDLPMIRAWWEQWPDANVAIATGNGLAVLDVDIRHGGIESLERLGRLPETVLVYTGGGGRHYYFGSSSEIRCSVGKLAAGLDLKGQGGYVVAPPSVHESGRLYGWAPDHQLGELEFAAIPPSLLVDQRPVSTAAIGKDDSIPEGARNDTLLRLGGAMRAKGFSQTVIDAALKAENAARCTPPLTDREVEGIARSIGRYEPGAKPRGAENEADADYVARFKAASRSYWNLMSDETPEPEPIIGDVCYPASLASLIAVEGTGKGWLELHELVDLAQGRPFFGLRTRKTRCGLLSLEDTRRVLKARLPRVVLATQADEDTLRETLHVICPPWFNDLFDLLEPKCQTALRDWIRDLGLGFICVDTLSDAHSCDERDLRPVLWSVLPIVRETGAVLQFGHHEPKAIVSGRSRGQDVLAHRSRGDTRLSAKVRFCMHLQEKNGLLLLTFAKTNEGQRPPPIWLQQDEFGVLSRTEAPAQRGELAKGRRRKMVDALGQAGAVGMTPAALADRLRVGVRTVERYVREAPDEVETVGYTTDRRYRLTTHDKGEKQCRE